MNGGMNKNEQTLLIIVTVIAVALLVIFVVTIWAPFRFLFRFTPFERRPPPLSEIPGDIEFYYMAQAVVSTVNVTLLVILLAIYGGIYQKTHSQFTMGLMIFAAVLLLNAIVSNPLVIWLFGFRPFGLGPFALLPDLFTFAALVVLLYLSAKY